ncbi:MAG: hypothetical protein J5I81_13485, partial [Nitrococcus mobilis]|nr:hypothetical protein [Nitrococcus mobilis]
MRISRKILLTTVMLATLAGAPALWAGATSSNGSEEGMSMKGKDGMLSGQMENMPMMRLMSQMNEMLENCNQMRKTMM